MESPEHESSESSEVREGNEDSEGCCAAKAGKPKCSACSSGKPCSGGGRGDSLSAQDYLRAADLGIQDRPLSYIRGRLDAMNTATREDFRSPGGKGKKCGNSYIPASATCNNGQGGGGLARKVGTAAAVAGGVAAAAYGIKRGLGTAKGQAAMSAARSMAGRAGNKARTYGAGAASVAASARDRMSRGKSGGLAPYTGNGGGGRTTATRAGSIGNRARRAANTAFGQNTSGRQARQGMRNSMNSAVAATRRGGNFTSGNSLGNRTRRAVNTARTYGAGAASVASSARSAASNAWSRRRPRRRGGAIMPFGRRDSIWADGFTMDPSVFAS
jgi:hypothetical protein